MHTYFTEHHWTALDLGWFCYIFIMNRFRLVWKAYQMERIEPFIPIRTDMCERTGKDLLWSLILIARFTIAILVQSFLAKRYRFQQNTLFVPRANFVIDTKRVILTLYIRVDISPLQDELYNSDNGNRKWCTSFLSLLLRNELDLR